MYVYKFQYTHVRLFIPYFLPSNNAQIFDHKQPVSVHVSDRSAQSALCFNLSDANSRPSKQHPHPQRLWSACGINKDRYMAPEGS